MKVVEFLFSAIPLLIELFVKHDMREDLAKTIQELENDSNLPRIKTYDFIVVGGGSAGCVVAGRLSEKYNVLLLEAGGSPPPASDPPYFGLEVAAAPMINYFFQFTPQNSEKVRDGGVRFWDGPSIGSHDTFSVGKMLGGSGSHNDLVHNRGSPKDFDNWAQITGDSSWNYENVAKYFAKSEKFIGKRFGNDTEQFYGTEGPITVDTDTPPILPLWFEAGRELGFSIEDPNGFQIESFTPMNKPVNPDGKRSSSYTQYIKPFENRRRNLTVIRYANVSEILIDEMKRCYGVAYTRHGFPQISYASKEVILSAGASSSPLLLMKSGIGPVEILSEAQIPVKVPLESVGKLMSGHPSINLTPFHVSNTSLFPKIDPEDTENLIEDYREGKGILTSLLGGPQCFKTSTRAELGWPNLWISMISSIRTEDVPQVVSFFTAVGRARTRGSISLDTKLYRAGVRDDTQLGLIDFGPLNDPNDVEDMLEAINLVFQIVEETEAFRSINMTYAASHDPVCLHFEFRSDDYWKCILTQKIPSWAHICGSCGMGADASDSVVDTKLRVRGVTGLRIIDASVMPVVPNSNINAPVIMLAEKGADEIINTWS